MSEVDHDQTKIHLRPVPPIQTLSVLKPMENPKNHHPKHHPNASHPQLLSIITLQFRPQDGHPPVIRWRPGQVDHRWRGRGGRRQGRVRLVRRRGCGQRAEDGAAATAAFVAGRHEEVVAPAGDQTTVLVLVAYKRKSKLLCFLGG